MTGGMSESMSEPTSDPTPGSTPDATPDSMVDALVLEDLESVTDLGNYAARARRLDADGAMRLQVVGQVLAAWVGVLAGQGLMGDGTVLGLRTFALAESATLDRSVPLSSVTDRTHRTDLGTRFPLPPTHAFPQWAALSPPRSGWEPRGVVRVDELVHAATAGIAEVGEGAGPGSGALAVAELRRRVWTRVLDDSGGLVAGAGFAAYTLGFLTPEATLPVHAAGPWRRLTCPGGYVLIR